jgi:hypothetical protein
MIWAESPAGLLKDGSRNFAVAPVQRLYLGWLGPRAARKVAQWPFLSRLRSFEALGAEDRSVVELARSPFLGSLRRLKLEACGITSAGLAALVEAPWFGSLTHLDLRSNRIDDEGARALARTPHRGQLRCLDLRSNPLSAAGQQVLREAFANLLERGNRLLLTDSTSQE